MSADSDPESQASDNCQRFIFADSDIRGEVVRLHGSFRELLQHQRYPQPVAELLGEFLTASVLLGSGIKFNGRLVLQARTQGPLKLVMAECTSEHHIRGIVRYETEDLDGGFHQLLRQGTLAITIEPEKGEAHQGIVALEQDNLAACLEDYFQRSEQLPSLIFLVASGSHCAGLLLQQMPPRVERRPQTREESWNRVCHLARTLTRDELLLLDNQTLLYRLFNELPVKVFPSRGIQHRCSCSRERTARALFMLGREEIMDIVAEQGGVEINCEFCGRQYNFGPQELEMLFEHPSADRVH